MTTKTPTPTAAITYDIERRDVDAYERGSWHGDIGEARGWPTIAAAEDAIDSLGELGAEWLGAYRIVESESRRVVEYVELEADASTWRLA